MAQYEPSRVLLNLESGSESENMQQYVEIGNNIYLGMKDGIKYALIPSSNNKFKLCEVPSDSSSSSSNTINSSWYSSFDDEGRNDISSTVVNGYKSLELMTPSEESLCKGQGDESGNSILSGPEPSPLYRNMNTSMSGQISQPMEKSQIYIDQHQTMTYTTLLPKQEIIQNENLLSYPVHQEDHIFAAPQTQLTPLTSRPGRFLRNRQRTQLMPHTSTPYPSVPHLLSSSNRGRQRRTKQMFYQYKTPDLNSTPNSNSEIKVTNISSILPDSPKDSSESSCNESLEYPRVPNNTPSSDGEMAGKQKVLDLQQWIPQLQSRVNIFSPIDPRESHNEKERKRRLRIKNACQSMKNLLPCVCDKTDNATVFENAVHFIAFMRDTVGTDYDMEFLEQTCVY